jgi:hypothetical protein
MIERTNKRDGIEFGRHTERNKVGNELEERRKWARELFKFREVGTKKDSNNDRMGK